MVAAAWLYAVVADLADLGAVTRQQQLLRAGLAAVALPLLVAALRTLWPTVPPARPLTLTGFVTLPWLDQAVYFLAFVTVWIGINGVIAIGRALTPGTE